MFKIFLRKRKNIRDSVIIAAASLVSEYSQWYSCHGLALPPQYARDPAAWTTALHKMERSFQLLLDDMNGEGLYYEAKNRWASFNEKDTAEIKVIEAEIIEGLKLFGENLFFLTDLPK